MPAVDQPAPNLDVAEWVQGEPGAIDAEKGKVILIEVFQVNCPGCFISGLPEAIDVYLKFRDQPLTVWGLATAFEDYHLNNLENLRKLLTTGEVVGQTLATLMERDLVTQGRLQYFIPFPVAWDRVEKRTGAVSDDEVQSLIQRDFPQFNTLPGGTRDMIRQQVRNYLKNKPYQARTFERYGLRGTPSSIIIDKQGNLRHTLFGSGLGLESIVKSLLDE